MFLRCLILLAVFALAHGVGLNFFFFGDWGRNVPAANSESGINYEQARIAAQVNNFATKVKPSFICVLGDNFYENGVSSTTDPLWQKYYRSLYTAPATFVPWFPVFGNHDYAGRKPQAEIDYYLQRKDSRWTFPEYQYTRIWKIPGSSKTLQIVFINTVALCPEAKTHQTGFPTNPGNGYPNPDPSAASKARAIWQPTLKWINQTLSGSRGDWLLVAGHYHIQANSQGAGTTPEALCLQDRLLPLMKRYGVAAYMNGHQHNFQHHHIDKLHFLTVGHGCDRGTALLPGTPSGLLFNKTVGGFATMHVTGNNLHIKYIDENGKTIHSYSIPYSRRRKVSLRSR